MQKQWYSSGFFLGLDQSLFEMRNWATSEAINFESTFCNSTSAPTPPPLVSGQGAAHRFSFHDIPHSLAYWQSLVISLVSKWRGWRVARSSFPPLCISSGLSVTKRASGAWAVCVLLELEAHLGQGSAGTAESPSRPRTGWGGLLTGSTAIAPLQLRIWGCLPRLCSQGLQISTFRSLTEKLETLCHLILELSVSAQCRKAPVLSSGLCSSSQWFCWAVGYFSRTVVSSEHVYSTGTVYRSRDIPLRARQKGFSVFTLLSLWVCLHTHPHKTATVFPSWILVHVVAAFRAFRAFRAAAAALWFRELDGNIRFNLKTYSSKCPLIDVTSRKWIKHHKTFSTFYAVFRV